MDYLNRFIHLVFVFMFLCSSLSLGPKNETSNLAPFSQFEERKAALRSQLLAAGYKDPTELRRALTKENYLGRSLFRSAYLIPGLNKYVLKVPFFSSGKPIFWDEIKILSDPFPGMNLGQAIAQVGQEAFILKRQYGVPTGVSYMDNKKVKAHYTAQLKRAARMPQSAYNQFANIIIKINSRGYYFDSNPGNVLIDVEVKVRFVRIEMLNRRFPGLGHKAGAWDGRTIWIGNNGDQLNTFIHELSHVYGYGEDESTRRAIQDLDLIIANAGV